MSLRLTPKLMISFLVVGLLPFVISSLISLSQSRDALEEQAFNQLTGVRDIKKGQIQKFFAEREGDMGVLMETISTIRIEAINKLSAIQEIKKNQIEAFFNETLRGGVHLLKDTPLTAAAINAFENGFNEAGKTPSGPLWNAAERQYHPWLKEAMAENGYYDIFLISNSGDVVYTVTREADLGQNLITGKLKNSGLGKVFAAAKKAGDIETISFADFEPYQPSNGDPASFIAGGIEGPNGNVVGILAIQVSLDRINRIMSERTGLGKTGETYLVGPDQLMRSDSYLNSENHSVIASFRNPEKGSVNTKASKAAIAGNTGAEIVIDYNGNPVLSAYSPVKVFDQTWAILAEVDVAEAFVPLDKEGGEFYKKYIEKYGYYDLFVMNPDGYVFYTVTKEADYQTNMVDGKFKDSGLGQLTREVLKSKKFGIADFAPYAPSNSEPAAFIAQPSLDGTGEPQLIIALQLSLDAINSVMQQRDGMGETGETYLVGSDKLMRSDSFLDPKNHSVKASFANPSKGKVETKATAEAFAGKTASEIIIDYNGNPVLSAYTPLKIGHTTWALIAEIDESEAFSAISSIQTKMMMLAVVGIVLIAAAGVLIARGIAKPVTAMTGVMGELANNNLAVDVPFTEKEDEIGEMATSVNHFKQQMIKVKELEEEQERQKREADAQRKAAMIQMADTFEDSVGQVVQTVTSAATELQASSTQMSATATETSSQATTVAAAAEEASANVQTVASAAEELASSEGEISRHVHKSSEVADYAARQAEKTKATVENMVEEVGKIGAVVSLISDIAEQTNLLALNATIEAARAGDAGKGFAVVASEVKNLANQTAKATEEIAKQIGEVQNVTHEAATAISSIGETITEIDQIANSIAAAVEEQTAATGEIARNVEQASQGTAEVSLNIQSVEQAAGETGAAANQISTAASDLSRQAEVLREEVKRFLDKVRSDNSTMTLLEWDDSIKTGNGEIDKEHKDFIDMLNSYYSQMMSGQGGAIVDEMMNKFTTHFQSHLAHEEAMMDKAGYPQLNEHKKSHQMFMQQLSQLKKRHETGENVSIDFLNYMATWLKEHTMKYDKLFVSFLN